MPSPATLCVLRGGDVRGRFMRRCAMILGSGSIGGICYRCDISAGVKRVRGLR